MKAKLIAVLVAALITPAHGQSLAGDFVYLRDIDPSIIQDIRYATSNNFVGRPLHGYQAGECIVKREVGLRLKAVQQELAVPLAAPSSHSSPDSMIPFPQIGVNVTPPVPPVNVSTGK